MSLQRAGRAARPDQVLCTVFKSSSVKRCAISRVHATPPWPLPCTWTKALHSLLIFRTLAVPLMVGVMFAVLVSPYHESLLRRVWWKTDSPLKSSCKSRASGRLSSSKAVVPTREITPARTWRGIRRSRLSLVTPTLPQWDSLADALRSKSPTCTRAGQQHWRPTLRVEQQTERSGKARLGEALHSSGQTGKASDYAEDPSAEVRGRIHNGKHHPSHDQKAL